MATCSLPLTVQVRGRPMKVDFTALERNRRWPKHAAVVQHGRLHKARRAFYGKVSRSGQLFPRLLVAVYRAQRSQAQFTCVHPPFSSEAPSPDKPCARFLFCVDVVCDLLSRPVDQGDKLWCVRYGGGVCRHC